MLAGRQMEVSFTWISLFPSVLSYLGFYIFRSFQKLSMINLFRLQAELAQLERSYVTTHNGEEHSAGVKIYAEGYEL
jgi:hypothetical protein